MVLGFFLLASLPLIFLLGTWVFWGLLPFVLTATGALYYALRRNERDRQILEILTITPELTLLTRHNPRGPVQDWQSNTYWVKVALHTQGGPVPNYITLKGTDREVEIGAFLSEDERKSLYGELRETMSRMTQG